MEKAQLILSNFDARISKIKIKPKNNHTKVTMHSTMYDEKKQKRYFGKNSI